MLTEVHTMRKKIESTYDKIIKNKKRKANIDKEYKQLVISELLLAAMAKDNISVRRLAKEAGISPTIIQELKTGKRKNITVDTLIRVLNAVGYTLDAKPIR